MSRTSTKCVSFEALEAKGESAILVIRLMMACNDLSLANHALTEWRNEQHKNLKARQPGAGMYFVRIQMAHLYEGLKVLEALRDNQSLMSLVRQCDQQTQQSFSNLEPFLTGGSNRSELEQIVGQIRNNLTFHYNDKNEGKLIKWAVSDRAARTEARFSTITRGDAPHLWHFKVADDIVDSIAMRKIWRIPREADGRSEIDKIMIRARQICLWFLDFSGEFIWRYCKS